MRQICPNCQKSIDVPESAAGGAFDCPACGESFPVPKAYTPTVADPPAPDRPSPPPGFVPPAAAQPVADAPGAPEPAGELRTRGVTLAPAVVGWVPVACLTLCLVLTFFPWAGAYPGGYRVFSQNPWEAGVGDVHSTTTAVPELQQAEPEMIRLAPSNLFVLLYGVLLVATVLLAWAERVFATQPDAVSLPGPLAWLPKVWPYRFALLVGLTGLLLFLVAFQAWRGYGLETAVGRYAAARHDEAVKAADTKAKEQIAQIQIGMDAARFAARRTIVADAVLAAHVLAVLAVLIRLWLARRGTKPPPRVGVQY